MFSGGIERDQWHEIGWAGIFDEKFSKKKTIVYALYCISHLHE